MGKVPAKGYCGEPYETYKMPKAAVHVNVNPVESDEFNETKLGLQWQWHANYQQWYGMPTSMGVMRVYTDKNDGTIWHTPNLLLQKLQPTTSLSPPNYSLLPRTRTRWAVSS